MAKNIGARDESEPLPTVPDEHVPWNFDDVRMHPDFDMKMAIGVAIGAASMSWAETPTGEFDSTNAAEITDALYQEIQAMLSADLKQHLDAVGIRNTAVELAAQASSNSYQGDLLGLAKRIETYIAKGED
jgi:hypothetical protein